MPGANINHVSVTFENGQKREEYGPTKKAAVTISAAVGENEDGTVALAFISHMAMAKVADMLSAPKPETNGAAVEQPVAEPVEEKPVGKSPPARRTARPKEEPKAEPVSETEQKPELTLTAEAEVEDEWAAGEDDIVISDQELLSATSKRAGELGARDPIVKLIATFATRTEGAPFKVQEIPQAQRRDYLDKLANLKA